MWTIAASMHMDGPAAKWLQVYKLRYGLGSWEDFIAAVEEQFGSYDYHDSLLLLTSNTKSVCIIWVWMRSILSLSSPLV